jgi:hypothetical protein
VAGHTRELDTALDALKDSGGVSDANLRNLAPHVDLASLFAT